MRKEDAAMKQEIINKALNNDGDIFFAIQYDYCGISFGAHALIARKLKENEKHGYLEPEKIFISEPVDYHLKHLNLKDLPFRTPDGSFLGSLNYAWIISYEEWNNYIELNNSRQKEIDDSKEKKRLEEEAQKRKIEAEKQALLAKIDKWDISEKTVYDEGGQSKVYFHNFLVNGEQLSFVERSIFDVGIVINPNYSVIPGEAFGGIALSKDGVTQWYKFDSNQGDWNPVRPLTDNENLCIKIVSKYGKYANSPIRM